MAKQEAEEPPIPDRCPQCGCLYVLIAYCASASLATPAQQREIIESARPEYSRDYVRKRVAEYGRRPYWCLKYRCPGCGTTGTRYSPERTQAEVEAVATQRALGLEVPAERAAIAGWQDQRRRRIERDSRLFADLLLSRLAEWEPYVRFVSPPSFVEQEPRRECGLVVRVPSANPKVDFPLSFAVTSREVTASWGELGHTHHGPSPPDDGANPRHLERAAEFAGLVAAEEVVFYTLYSEGRVLSGSIRAAAEPAPDIPDAVRGRVDRAIVRSWRGKHDRDLPL